MSIPPEILEPLGDNEEAVALFLHEADHAMEVRIEALIVEMAALTTAIEVLEAAATHEHTPTDAIIAAHALTLALVAALIPADDAEQAVIMDALRAAIPAPAPVADPG